MLNLVEGKNLLSVSSASVLTDSLTDAQTTLHDFATSSNFAAILNLAFGDDYNIAIAHDLAQTWAARDFNSLPAIEICAGSEINNANGAFAAQTNKIYLSSDFLTQNTSNLNAVTAVLLEEIGHAIDVRINTTDAAGDEGDIFSRLVRGEKFSALDLLPLKTEDDQAIVTINGRATEIEMSQIAMASLNGRMYQSVQGMDNKIYTRSSTDGTNWSGWTKTDDGWTESAPAMTVYQNKLFQSIRGTDNAVYVRTSSSGTTWDVWKKLDGQTMSAPAITVGSDGKLVLTVKGMNNLLYARTFDGTNWSKDWLEQQTKGSTLNSPAVTTFKGQLVQAVRGETDNQVYTRFSTDNGKTWAAWQADGQTASAPAMAVYNNRLYQVVRGLSDDRIYMRSTSDGKTWGTWSLIGTATDVTPTAPAIAVNNGKLYLSVQGMDNRVYTRSFNGSNWGAWNVSGQTELTPTEIPDLLAKPMTSPNSAQQYNTWHGTYFNSSNLSGAPVVGGMTAKIDYNWGTASPLPSINKDNFSARYEGVFQFDAGKYTFKPSVDDGMRIWIDGQLVHDSWNSRTGSNFERKITAGLHSIKVEYHELGGNAFAKFSWDKIISPPGLMATSDYLAQLQNGQLNGQPIDVDGQGANTGRNGTFTLFQCWDLVAKATGYKASTSTWKRGENIIANGNVSVGTAIATFSGPNNAYDSSSYQHTAIFAGYTYDAKGRINGFNVWDQNWYNSDPKNPGSHVKYHSISINGLQVTDADNYYVIEV